MVSLSWLSDQHNHGRPLESRAIREPRPAAAVGGWSPVCAGCDSRRFLACFRFAAQTAQEPVNEMNLPGLILLCRPP